jgi:predicted peptidase
MLFRKREVAVGGISTIYRVYAPPRMKGPLPVILFLHGRGESGSDGLAQTTVGIGPAIRRHRERFPAIVVFPQSSTYGWRGVNLDAAVAALDDVEQKFDVDLDRVYLTGLSMGGYGTWHLAVQQPERFAAIVPVCGGFDERTADVPIAEAAKRIAAIPHWVFHGDADNIVPVEQSRRMVRALREAGGDVRYTEYAGVTHNSWDRAYAETELWPWFLRQRRNL